MFQLMQSVRGVVGAFATCIAFYAALSFSPPALPNVIAQTVANEWRAIGPTRSITVDQIYSLAMASGNPETIYAGTNAGLFKTTNGGASWSRAGVGLPYDLAVTSVAVSRANNNVVYAGVRNVGVFKSTDGGAVWSQTAALPNVSGISLGDLTLGLSATSVDKLYVSLETRGVFKSTNGGTHWTEVFPSTQFGALAVSPANDELVLINVNSTTINPSQASGILRSTNGGQSWTQVRGDYLLKAITFVPGSPNRVVIYSTGSTHLLSTDAGATWTESQLPARTGTAGVAISPSNPQIVYTSSGASTFGGGVFKSTDGGVSFTNINGDYLNDAAPHPALVVHPTNPSIVYVGTLGRGLYKTTDGGASWQASYAGLEQVGMEGIVGHLVSYGASYSNANVIYATVAIGPLPGPESVFKTTDGGATWVSANSVSLPPLRASISSDDSIQAVEPNNPDGVFVRRFINSAANDSIRTTNGGTSWQRGMASFGDSPLPEIFSISKANPNLMYGQLGRTDPNGGGPYRSLDGGVTWSRTSIGPEPGRSSFVGFSEAQAGVVFFNNQNQGIPNLPVGYYRSTDSGSTRTFFATTGPTGLRWESSPANGSVFYSIPLTNNVSKSIDGGATWTATTALPDGAIAFELEVSPANANVVYVTTNLGVYKTSDGGASWQALRNPFNVIGNRLSLDVTGTVLRIQSNGQIYEYRDQGGTGCVAPVVQIGPGTQRVCEGLSWQFTANVSAGTPPLTYVWRKNGQVIAGATGATISGTATVADAGDYQVTVTNACGSSTSTFPGTLMVASLALLQPSTVSVPATASTGVIDGAFSANDTLCPGISASSNVPWITITGPSGRIGYGYSVAANTGAARTGIVTLRHTSGSSVTRTINQAAGSTGTTQDVIWTQLTNAQVFGNILRKVGGSTEGAWDGRAVSQQSIASGDVTLNFTVSGPSIYRAIGLSNDLPSGIIEQLDYAVYLTDTNIAEFRENGVYRGGLYVNAGDIIRIEVKAGRVNFYVNGILQGSTVNGPRFPLRVVALMSLPGAEFANARLSTGGVSCSYSISPTSETIASGSSSGVINLITQSGCPWTATSNASWLTLTGVTSGSGSASIPYTASANAGPARTGVITVDVQTFTVSQAAGNQVCTFTITPTNVNLSAAENTGTISVTTQAGCGWQLIPTTPGGIDWLVWEGGDSRIGSGSVNYRVFANTGAQRSVVLTIAGSGKTVTLTQAAGNTTGNNVQWTNLVNTTVVGTALRKTGGIADGRYDGKANSVQTITSGEAYLEFTLSGTAGARSIGLSDALPTSLDAIDYEMRFTSNYVEFRERGVYLGDAITQPGDVFRLAIVGGRVSFYVNGVARGRATTTPPFPIRVVALMDTMGGEFSAAKLISGRPPTALAESSTTKMIVTYTSCRGNCSDSLAAQPAKVRHIRTTRRP